VRLGVGDADADLGDGVWRVYEADGEDDVGVVWIGDAEVSGTDSLTPLKLALAAMCLFSRVSSLGSRPPHLTDDGKFCCVASPFLSASATRTLSTPLVQV
jgi:hypothetical protein